MDKQTCYLPLWPITADGDGSCTIYSICETPLWVAFLIYLRVLPLSDIDFRFSFHKLCFSCSFLLILNNEKISKKFWAMAAHQKLNSLISVFLITLINPLKKNNLGAKVSVTQDWRLHPPSAVPGRRERKFITQHRCQ